MRTTLVSLAALIAVLPAAASAQSLQTERMRFVDSKKPTPAEKPLVDAWMKSAKPEMPDGVLYQSVKVGQKTISFVLGQSGACDGGANSINSEQNWETCPLTVISEGPDGTQTQVSGTACYSYPTARNDPGVDPLKNYVSTSYDTRNRVFEINTYRDGVAVPECKRSLAVQ